jgi:hypothetical protein
MSGKNLELSLTMRLRDLMSSGFARSQRDMQANIAKTEKSTENLTRTVSNLGKVRSAAEVLGIRTEQNIQREIQRTEAAYKRLAASGTMSMREQARAAEATRNRVRELNNEMGKYTLGQKAMRGLQNGATVAGGMAAGGYVLGKPIGQTMDYGMQLAHASNTAFDKRDKLGRAAGKQELNTAIVNSVRTGGGTRESGLETLDSIIGSNALSAKDAMSILPSVMKAATASGADSKDLGQIGVRALQGFKIKKEEFPVTLDIANAAGKAGGFELKDMAKWLPQQMAMATNIGMSGKADFAKLTAWNQASVITSGTKDEAGNNLRDLLMEVNTPHFAKHLQNVGVKDPNQYFLKSQANGVNKVEATIALMDQIVGHNKDYQALQKQYQALPKDPRDAAANEKKKQINESMSKLVEGTAFGQVFHNQQSLMALLSLKNNKDVITNALQDEKAGEGNSIQKDFDSVSAESAFKVQQAENEKIFATQNAFENLTPLVGSVADGFSAISKEYPNLTAATIAATTGLTALAAAALGMAGVATLIGGKGAGGLTESILSKTKAAPGALGRGALAVGSAFVSTAAVGAMAAGTAGYGVGTFAYEHGIKGTSLEDKIGGMIATIMAGWGNQEAKQALQINLHMDGEQIASVMHKRDSREASRH